MVVNEKQKFLTSLATTAYCLVFGVHFTVFGLMLLRSIQGDTYELPLVTWAVWLIIGIGTPIAFFTPKGKTYQFRAALTQSILITSLAFGLANSGMTAITIFNLPLIALLGAIFFSRSVALQQLAIALLVLMGFLSAKLLGYLPEVSNADWIVNSNYRWTLKTAYIVLFSTVIVYFLQKYVSFTFNSVNDLTALQEAVDEAPDAFVVWDENDCLFMSNKRYKNLDPRLAPSLRKGVSFEETLRKGIQIGMYPEALGQEEKWIEERLRAHRQKESSKLVRLDDGRWMNVVESRTSSGYLAGFRTNVTPLINSQDLLQATLDSVSEAVVTMSREGKILTINAASKAMFGYSLSEIKGQQISTIAREEELVDLSKELFADAKTIEIGSFVRRVQTRLSRKDGSRFIASIELRDVEINGEQVFISFIIDLTRKKEFESTVKALSSAVEELAAGIVLLNNESQITYNNAYFSKLLNIPSQVAIAGLSINELFDRVALQIKNLDAVGAESNKRLLLKFYENLSTPITLFTKTERILSLRVQALEGGNTILTLTDNTDEQQRQLQLEQTTKLATLGEMAAGIAHELNQPLNAIKLTANNLIRQYQHDKAKAEQTIKAKLEQISSQVDRAAKITDHMRTSARLANEQHAVADIAQVVKDTNLLVESSLRLESIEFRTQIDASLPHCKLHPIRLEQVLLNLVTNTRDAFKERQTDKSVQWILISARQKNPQTLELKFEDSAGGIPKGALERVFDPFYTTKEVGKGTGLGLSISYSIITDAGGTLSVKNTGVGAQFTILLPT